MKGPQRELRDYMKRLSQKRFRNDWENGLEYILWHWMKSGNVLTPIEAFTLFSKSNRARGWVVNGEDGQEFVGEAEWLQMFFEEFGDE